MMTGMVGWRRSVWRALISSLLLSSATREDGVRRDLVFGESMQAKADVVNLLEKVHRSS
jgi:hypothetical protein